MDEGGKGRPMMVTELIHLPAQIWQGQDATLPAPAQQRLYDEGSFCLQVDQE
jgi:hypothetical protein